MDTAGSQDNTEKTTGQGTQVTPDANVSVPAPASASAPAGAQAAAQAETPAQSLEAQQEALLANVGSEEAAGTNTMRASGITALVVVMVLFIRIMAVSNWNWDIAAELAEAFDFDDAVPILFGTLFEMPIVSGAAAGALLPIAFYRLYLIRKKPDEYSKASDWLLILMLAIVLFVLGHTYGLWWPAIGSAIFMVAIVVFVWLVHTGETLKLLDDVTRRIGTVLAVVFLFMAVTVTTPWNPREEIGLKDEVIVGHIIEVTPGFIKVLTEDRDVAVFLTGDVQYRKAIEIEE